MIGITAKTPYEANLGNGRPHSPTIHEARVDAEVEALPTERAIWVGTSRQGRFRSESERRYRHKRLAEEMNDACDTMLGQGLRLANIVRVSSSCDMKGGWTEGAWLHFARVE